MYHTFRSSSQNQTRRMISSFSPPCINPQRRVVVTGLGLVTPLGCDVGTTWKNLLSGASGVDRISRFDASDIPCQISAEVPTTGPGAFKLEEWIDRSLTREIPTFVAYAMAAAKQALEDSKWDGDRTTAASFLLVQKATDLSKFYRCTRELSTGLVEQLLRKCLVVQGMDHMTQPHPLG
eukprot:TRINITY_DN892_c0_g1_i15.p1 TRINITY_DN892_c0_g1~~TRINITY_DN892_c0_g1_i15.p1  ORF type:complete len:179 (-),score=38.20 TRINITY_DN892_c0_g1_i15:1435-1971(-)